MDTVTAVLVVLLVVGGVAAFMYWRRRGSGTGTGVGQAPKAGPGTPHGPWNNGPAPVGGPKRKVRVLSVTGSKHVPVATPPPPLSPPAKKPAHKPAKKPGTGAPAHVTKVLKVPAFCPICGRVDGAGCPGKH